MELDPTNPVPPGPYLHGSREELKEGEQLKLGLVNPNEGDNREHCFATTSLSVALDWAYRRAMFSHLEWLFVYEVTLSDPEVDANMHSKPWPDHITSVMSPHGQVTRRVCSVAVSTYEIEIGQVDSSRVIVSAANNGS